MADVSIKWKNQTLAEMSASGSKTLKTEGKYLDADVIIEYVKSAGASFETSTFKLTSGRMNAYTIPATKSYQYVAIFADLTNADVDDAATNGYVGTISGEQDAPNQFTVSFAIFNRKNNVIAYSYVYTEIDSNVNYSSCYMRKLRGSGAFSAYYTQGAGITVQFGSSTSVASSICLGKSNSSPGKLTYRWVAWGEAES